METIRNAKKIIFIMLIVCFLSSCSKPLSKKDAVYVYTYERNGYTVIDLLDEDGNEVYTEKVDTIADISYSYFKQNTLYLYGPGGLIKFSVDNQSIDKIVDGAITLMQVTELGLLYEKSEGISLYGIYMDDSLLFTVDYPIHSIYYKDDIIYISNISFNNDSAMFVATYDTEGNLLKKENVEALGAFQEFQDNVCYVSTKGYRDLENEINVTFPIVQNSLYNPLIYSDDLRTVDHRNGKTCEVLNQSQGVIEDKIDCDYITSAQNGIFALRYENVYTIIDLNKNKKEELYLEREDISLEKLFVIDK